MEEGKGCLEEACLHSDPPLSPADPAQPQPASSLTWQPSPQHLHRFASQCWVGSAPSLAGAAELFLH